MNRLLRPPDACRDARALMLEGIEGRLPIVPRLEVESHLARCGSCADELADLAATHTALRRAYARYARAQARVAPARARLLAADARSSPLREALALLARVARPAEQAVAFAVVAFLFAASGQVGQPERVEIAGEAEAPRVLLLADDALRNVYYRQGPSARIPVPDALVIDVAPLDLPDAETTRGGTAR